MFSCKMFLKRYKPITIWDILQENLTTANLFLKIEEIWINLSEIDFDCWILAN